ncbi:tetratricopeptide repeat protein [Micromonospora sp. NPDC005299]|uniref:tetratricopeptide repeat protein n=1 Tax=Micromonospora sp. NPDC005299 TaxID=3364231 RepID=UPI00368E320D
MANAWDSLGYALVRANLYRRGISHYQRALRLFRGVGARLDEAEVLDHLGDAYAAVGETANARRSWSDSVAILETVDSARASDVRDKLTGIMLSIPPAALPITASRSARSRPRRLGPCPIRSPPRGFVSARRR